MDLIFTAFVEKEGTRFHKKIEAKYQSLAETKLMMEGCKVLDINKGTPVPPQDCVCEMNARGYGQSSYLTEFLTQLYSYGY